MSISPTIQYKKIEKNKSSKSELKLNLLMSSSRLTDNVKVLLDRFF
jgi:hypothetical protein